MNAIIIGSASVAIIGLIIGILLVFVGRKFAVETDPKTEAIRGALPGNNCGGCGFAGCDALAAAISAGEAPANACPVGGSPVSEIIAHIMGQQTDEESVRKVAFVKCSGDCTHTFRTANYYGLRDCQMAAASGIQDKSCNYGCMGYGSCIKACDFNAIRLENGIAFVDREKCKSCGKCVAVCPRHLIELIPDTAKYVVQCSSPEKGPAVKKACTAGCIGCRMCIRQCQSDAVLVENNLSRIDYDLCHNCGKCAEKCPSKVIRTRFEDTI